MGIDVKISYFLSLILIPRYCGMKRPGPTLLVHVQETGSTDRHATSLHKGGWRVSVSPTLVESDSTEAVLVEG